MTYIDNEAVSSGIDTDTADISVIEAIDRMSDDTLRLEVQTSVEVIIAELCEIAGEEQFHIQR